MRRAALADERLGGVPLECGGGVDIWGWASSAFTAPVTGVCARSGLTPGYCPAAGRRTRLTAMRRMRAGADGGGKP